MSAWGSVKEHDLKNLQLAVIDFTVRINIHVYAAKFLKLVHFL